MSDRLLTLDHLRVWFGTERGPARAVDGVDLTLDGGEIVALVGESGSGKTTLARAVLGLAGNGAHIDGGIRIGGADLAGADESAWQRVRGSGIGMVFQDPLTRLNPLLRISAHFDEILRVHRPALSRAERRKIGLAALREVGIPESRWSNYPHEFSGGMRQRIAIALTLVLEPRIIVADEPTTALDVLIEAQILRLLRRLRDEKGTAILLITHDLGVVAEVADRVAVMYAGRVVEQGPTTEIFGRPRHPYTQGLLASTITAETTELTSIPGSPPDLVDSPAGCRFHPRCDRAMLGCARHVPTDEVHGEVTVQCFETALHLLSPGERVPLVSGAVSA